MLGNKKVTQFISTGIVLAIIGIILIICGVAESGDYNSIHSSRSNPVKTIYYIGIGASIIGGILIVVGTVIYIVSKRQAMSSSFGLGNTVTRFTGKYTNVSGSYSVIFKNDGTCIWLQNGEQYNAVYRYVNNNEWKIYISGFGEAFRFSIISDGIYVEGGPVNERFSKEEM